MKKTCIFTLKEKIQNKLTPFTYFWTNFYKLSRKLFTVVWPHSYSFKLMHPHPVQKCTSISVSPRQRTRCPSSRRPARWTEAEESSALLHLRVQRGNGFHSSTVRRVCVGSQLLPLFGTSIASLVRRQLFPVFGTSIASLVGCATPWFARTGCFIARASSTFEQTSCCEAPVKRFGGCTRWGLFYGVLPGTQGSCIASTAILFCCELFPPSARVLCRVVFVVVDQFINYSFKVLLWAQVLFRRVCSVCVCVCVCVCGCVCVCVWCGCVSACV